MRSSTYFGAAAALLVPCAYGSPLASRASLNLRATTTISTSLELQVALSNCSTPSEYQAVYQRIKPSSTPTSIANIQSIVELNIGSTTSTSIYDKVGYLILNGITPSSVATSTTMSTSGPMSMTNSNTKTADKTIYPKKSSSDAPYSLTEAQLREVIYIPSSFGYGKTKQPVILVPGTGNNGYETFSGNYIPLLQSGDVADPVWLNIPGFLLADAQVSAEYVAYAINYISAISSNANVSVIAWSQGSIDSQWALKYWPSTRTVTSDLITISGDYHGTEFANDLCFLTLGFCDPSVLQQEYTSNFITTLRNNGGDSAYVPTTNVYSGLFDEIVEPQQGTAASAYLLDARSVGVSNTEVQEACPAEPAGGFYTHEGVLYNAIGYALAIDALTHTGPGNLARAKVSMPTACSLYASPGLTLADVLLTETSIVIAAVNLLAEMLVIGTTVEPAIMSYAA